MKPTRILAIATCSLCCLGALCAAEDFQYPKLRIPELSRPPQIDGKITEGEYDSALSFTGSVGNPLGTPFLLAEKQQVTWFLGFKGDILYIAMRSPHAKGSYPVGRAKGADNTDVLWGDHTEIQILTNKREDASKPGPNLGFYKIVNNALGTQWDFHWLNGTPGTEDLWTTGGVTKSGVTEDAWELELSVKASAVGLKQWEGSTFVLQLIRADSCSGMYFAGLAGGSWMNWPHFAEAVCDASSPAFHLKTLGEPMEGRIDVKTSANARAGGPQKIHVSVSVQDAAGTQLLDQSETLTAQTGKTTSATIKKDGLAVTDVPLDGGRNWIEVKAAWQDGQEEKILFRNRVPFMKMTPEWRAKYLDAWLATKPAAGQWDATFAYLPYSGKALAKVDLDFFGVPAEAKKAKRFSVEVRKKGDPAKIAGGAAELASLAGEALVSLPDLADGDYEAVFKLDSGPSQTIPFQRKRHPFEHNTLGLGNEVVPPYLPVVVNPEKPAIVGGPARSTAIEKPKGDVVIVWGRAYEFGPNALPSRIQAAPPTGAAGTVADILAAPVRLEATTGGKPLAIEASGSRILEALPHKAVVEADAKADNLAFRVQSTVEYDGWVQTAVTLKPAGEITLDSLDLVVDVKNFPGDAKHLPSPADTLYVQRMGGGVDNSYHGEIQAKPGVTFDSSQIGPMTARTGPCDIAKDWKTFVPICYLGGADRGLWFFAWSDKGWTLKDGQPALTVERLKDGNARLRVRLIAGPEKIDKERTLTFALQASPIKANDPEYRTRVNSIAHDSSGFRYYGDSVDGFVLLSDEDYKKLREFLMYGIARENDPDKRYASWAGRIGKAVSDGRADRIMLYGSQWMTGAGSQEFGTYGGEWLGNSDWKPSPEAKFTGNKNYGGTVTWTTPQQLSAFRVNWPQSMLDFFVFYHDRLIDKAGINGTWWDNCYGGVVTDYDPELGRLDSVWNLFPRRQLCKRLNVVGWEHLRPPCWSLNSEVEMAWCQVYWLVEGFWGAHSKDIPVLDHYAKSDGYANNTGLGFFRAALRPKSNSMVVTPSAMGSFGGTTPEKDRAIKRGADGLLLAHDVPAVNDKELMRKLQFLADYENTSECLFIGYWQSAPFVGLPSKDVVASIYQNPTRKTAAVVVFNQSDKEIPLQGTLLAPAGIIAGSTGNPADANKPLKLKRCYDLETGQEIKLVSRDGRLAIDEPLAVAAQGMRVIALEAE